MEPTVLYMQNIFYGFTVLNATPLQQYFSYNMTVSFLVEEHGENHRPVASYWQTLLHNFVSSTSRLSGIQTPNVSGDRHWLHIVLGSYKSNYHIITTMTAPARYMISVIKYVFNNITIKLKSSQALFTIIYGNMA